MTESEITGSGDDRRGFMKGAAVTAAAVGAGALAPGSAYPVGEPFAPGGSIRGGVIPLPPIGVDLPCRCYATTVPLKLDALGLLTLDFKGGINFCVRTSKEEGLGLEIRGYRVEADRNPNTPNSGTLIAITMSNATSTPLSVLQPSSTGGLEMLLYLSLTVEVIDKATMKTTCILSTDPRKYATLKATDVRSFPPASQLYTLQEPVKLYPQGGSQSQGTAPAGDLQAFDVIIN